LETDLHAVFLLSPIAPQFRTNWNTFSKLFEKYGKDIKPVARILGIEDKLHQKFYSVMSGTNKKAQRGEEYCVCTHFFGAVILYITISEKPIYDVAEEFGITRGELQALQSRASMYASMVTTFAHHLRWAPLRNIFKEYIDRLHHGVQDDLIALVQIPLVTSFRARALLDAGYTCINHVAEADARYLEEIFIKVQPFKSKTEVDAIDAEMIKGIELRLAKKVIHAAKSIVSKAKKHGGVDLEWLYGTEQPSTPDGKTYSPGKAGSPTSGRYSTSQHYKKSQRYPRTPQHGSPSNATAQKRLFSTPGRSNTETGGTDTKRMRLSPESIKYAPRPPVPNKPRPITPPTFKREPTNWRFEYVVVQTDDEFEYFVSEILSKIKQFAFSLHLATKKMKADKKYTRVRHMPVIRGIAFCWTSKQLQTRAKDPDNPDVHHSNHAPVTATMVKEVYFVDIDTDVNSVRYNSRLAKLKPIFEAEHTEKICFDTKYNLTKLIYVGYNIPINSLLDPKIAAWMKNPKDESKEQTIEEICKLQLASLYDGHGSASGSESKQVCKQAWQSLLLLASLLPVLDQVKLLRSFRNSEMPLVSVLAEMEYVGFGFDPEVVTSLKPELSKKMKELKEEMIEEAGQVFDADSPASIANILYDVKKLVGIETTNQKNKQKSTTKRATKGDVLAVLIENYPDEKIIPMIREYRTLKSAMSKQVKPYVTQHALYDPTQDFYRVYTRHLQTTSCTGRVMTTDPNLQNTPNPISFVKANLEITQQFQTQPPTVELNIRKALVPIAGHVLLSVDYSAIELRVLAHFSRDNNLIQLLTDPNTDIFRQIAARMFSKTEEDINEQERSIAKQVVYGIIYGMGDRTLGDKLFQNNSSKDPNLDKRLQAKLYREQFLNRFPMVKMYTEKVKAFVTEHHYVLTLFSRRRYVPEITSNDTEEQRGAHRKALNAVCQGSAADLMKIAMINIRNKLRELDMRYCTTDPRTKSPPEVGYCARMMLSVHDELLFEVRKEHLEEVTKVVKKCMEDAGSQLLVPFPVRAKVGQSWGSLRSYL
jgi:DNA polymerase theta